MNALEIVQRVLRRLREVLPLTRPTVEQREAQAIEQLYQITAADWLELTPSYRGSGTAAFSTNAGVATGPTDVRFAEDGTIEEFTMRVSALDADVTAAGPDSIFIFVHGLPIAGSPGSFSLGPRSNECESVEVTGENFTVRPTQRSSVITNAGNDEIHFKPYRTIARFATDATPRYFVAPLLNLVVDWSRVEPALHDHPLRLRRTATYQPVDGPNRVWHDMFYRRGNTLIPFLCEHEPAFVEPLLDYAERSARVQQGEAAVTAVMVGSLPEAFDEKSEDWFPADLVTLLGIASGRSIAVPFVELRSETGELVARMHVRIGDTDPSSGRPLIDERISGTTGDLLTSFLVSDHATAVWFRVMLKHLLRAYTAGGTVEDKLSHLFRAVEGACAGLGLNTGRPLEVQAEVRHAIEGAFEQFLDALQVISKGATHPEDRDRTARLRNRARGLAGNSPPFQTQLLELLQRVGLPDTEWLANFKFRTRVDRKKRKPVSWAQAANDYRNRLVHSGFIDFEKFDVDNGFAFIGHLSDVLARVTFHLIGFVGEYAPPCGNAGARTYERPTWAQPTTLNPGVFRYIG